MKDILVHLDGGKRSSLRLDVAIGLARRFDARLIGLFAESENSVVAKRSAETLEGVAQQLEEDFQQRLSAAGVPGKWWRVAETDAGHVVGEVVFCSRYADLVVLGQWNAEDATVPEELVEQVVLNSGRPVLVIPHAGDVATLGERISVAWNASREATRALHEALPFLEGASDVNLLAVRDPAPTRRGEKVPQATMVDHLAVRGIKARIEHLPAENIGVMDLLLSRAFDLGSDLLVMGAHSGLGLSFMRGAGTRFMLRHMTMPVLMSN